MSAVIRGTETAFVALGQNSRDVENLDNGQQGLDFGGASAATALPRPTWRTPPMKAELPS
jgi:hypothetical protein